MNQPLKAPTVRTWPMTLDAAIGGPVERHCPAVCPFSLLCPTWVQQGTLPLWTAGRITRPADCVHYEQLRKTHVRTTGRDVPATAAELMAQLGARRAAATEQQLERAAIQSEAGPA